MKTSICGNDVEGDALGELLRLDRVGDEDRAGLREQLVHRLLAGAGDRLVGRDHHALDRGAVVQRLQRHDELGGRAVRVGDDVLLAEAPASPSAFTSGTTSGTSGSIAPGRGIVDDDAALGADLRRPFLRDGAARRHEADVRVGKIVVLERLALERPVAERDLRARSRRREASATTSSTGNRRSARMASISRPTLPVAPATATLKPGMKVFLLTSSDCLPAMIRLKRTAQLRRPPGGQAGGKPAFSRSSRLFWRGAVLASIDRRSGIAILSGVGREKRRRGFRKPRRGRVVNARVIRHIGQRAAVRWVDSH